MKPNRLITLRIVRSIIVVAKLAKSFGGPHYESLGDFRYGTNRTLIVRTILTLSIACYGVLLGAAAEPATIEEPPSASCCDPIVVYRQVYLHETLPELGSRLYDKVDYELKIRKLTRDIRVAEAELVLRRDRVRVYDRDFGRTTALYLTRQEAKLDVLKSEERLKLLRQEQLLALRHRNDQVRYRELLLAEGAGRLQLAK